MTMASKKTLAGMLMWVACGAAWAEAPALHPDHDYAFEWRESGYTFTDLNDNKVIAQVKSGARSRNDREVTLTVLGAGRGEVTPTESWYEISWTV